MVAGDLRLSPKELQQYRQAGYLVRRAVFSPGEISTIRAACETLVDKLVRNRRGQRMTFGSYTFDIDTSHNTVIKWEGDTEIVHGIEPFAHLSPQLRERALDARLIEPMIDILNTNNPMLFTEKLNLKRPRHGGANPLHQDYPYWINVADVAAEVATTMLLLDDSTPANGCLHVVPGSHQRGLWTRRDDGDQFAANEIDGAAYPTVVPVALDLKAGDMVMFGPLLVHQSAPNHSDQQRRALLFSYQPPGRRTQLEALIAGWKQQTDT